MLVMEESQTKIWAMANNGSCSSNQQQEEEDRLSSLPDNLLISILCLLPIRSAVATSALSRRWRHLWTHTTNLDFHNLSCKSFLSAARIVGGVISHLNSPKIHTFHLHLPSVNCYYYLEVNPNRDWFLQICRRNPEIITIQVPSFMMLVPYCLFETQSLVHLELHHSLDLDCLLRTRNSMMPPVRLPNLKKLTLSLLEVQLDLVAENGPLLKGCPLLQDLSLVLCMRIIEEQDGIRTVDLSSNPNLKRLALKVNSYSNSLSLVEDKFKVVIDAPKLEVLELSGRLTSYDFVETPSNLQAADIILSREDETDYKFELSGLIPGISSVRSLRCGLHLFGYISHLETAPMFGNLINLSLFINTSNVRVDKLPGCFLLGDLKRVEISIVALDGVELDLIKHLLSNATVLEDLSVSFRSCYSRMISLEEEIASCKKIMMLSKSSVKCRVEILGLSITTSSDEFKDGVLICRIYGHPDSHIVITLRS